MATIELVKLYKQQANKPTTNRRQMLYLLSRIEAELQCRANNAAKECGVKFIHYRSKQKGN